MPRSESGLPRDAVAALEAIDATLAGEPADPRHAELAELALILRSEAPRPAAAFAAALDERVDRRFATPEPRRAQRRRRRLPAWLLAPAVAATGLVALVVVLVVLGGGARSVRDFSGASSDASSSSASAAASGAVSGSASSSASSAAAPSQRTPMAPLSPAAGPVPSPGAKRQVVQSAQLQLAAPASRINDVAQGVFDVVGDEKGIVESSHVTTGAADAAGGGAGGADFQLSVPSANLSATLTSLSQLRGANVVSRTDATSDITGQVGGAGERLAEARALRRSLLAQLAAATTTAGIDSLRLRLRDANASIASDLSTLNGIKRQVAYSRISVNLAVAAPAPATGSSFGLSRGAHDAGRVLVVAGAVALICLAVAVPAGLLVALAVWVAAVMRRRRREQALDLV